MTKALEFRNRAEQFRQLAAQFPSQDFRQVILGLASTWEQLADDRERLLPHRAGDHGASTSETIVTVAGPGSENEVPKHEEHETHSAHRGSDEAPSEHIYQERGFIGRVK